MSKLANLLFTVDMQKRYNGKIAASVALHPGVISTNLPKGIGFWTLLTMCGGYRSGNKVGIRTLFSRKTISQGSSTTNLCALDPKISFGNYYSDCQLCDEVHDLAFEEDLASEFFQVTEELQEKAKIMRN